MGANKFGVVDDCCALLCMVLMVALTVIGDTDDVLLLFSPLVRSLIKVTVDWLFVTGAVDVATTGAVATAVTTAAAADAVRGVGVCGGDVHSCIA